MMMMLLLLTVSLFNVGFNSIATTNCAYTFKVGCNSEMVKIRKNCYCVVRAEGAFRISLTHYLCYYCINYLYRLRDWQIWSCCGEGRKSGDCNKIRHSFQSFPSETEIIVDYNLSEDERLCTCGVYFVSFVHPCLTGKWP